MHSHSNSINDKISKIRSKYILQKIYYYLQKKNTLEIVKYNKKIKNKINIKNKDFEVFSQTYSSIKIGIIHTKNKYGTFINIKKEEQKYFHIFFNEEKEEIKRNYFKNADEVKKINIIIDYQVESFKGLFQFCKCIESTDFKQFYRNNINDMSGMFFGCTSLKILNINNFNTKNVTDMICMFSECCSLNELNLTNFDFSKVTNTSYMFYKCSSLKKIRFPNFNYDNINKMSYMFEGCSDELKMKIKARYKNIKEEAFK